MLGKAPPYLSSLVTMATPPRSMCSSRCFSLILPKANTAVGGLSFQFSAACDWNELQKSLKLETFISLTNFKHLLSEQLTNRCTVHSPSVNSSPNLPTSSPYCFYLFTFLLFCTPVSLPAHDHLIIYHSSVNLQNCNYSPTSSCLLHTMYMDSLFFLLCY